MEREVEIREVSEIVQRKNVEKGQALTLESSPSGLWKENKQPAQCTGNSKERSMMMVVATLKAS